MVIRRRVRFIARRINRTTRERRRVDLFDCELNRHGDVLAFEVVNVVADWTSSNETTLASKARLSITQFRAPPNALTYGHSTNEMPVSSRPRTLRASAHCQLQPARLVPRNRNIAISAAPLSAATFDEPNS